MNPEQPDLVRRTLVDLDDRLGRIADEMTGIRKGLAELVEHDQTAGREPREHRGADEPREAGDAASAPVTPAGHGRPQVTPTPEQSSSRPRETVWRPGQQQPVPPSPSENMTPSSEPVPVPVHEPAPVPEPVPSWWSAHVQPRITAATVIAAIGGAVMLAGVVFLLVAVIQAGLFPPVARVLAAAVLAVVLVGLGLFLQSRHEATPDRPVNPGALSLVGTGFATANLDVIASTTIYHWIPVPVAFTLVGALGLAGMILAQRWSSGLLACLISAGTMLLAPFISTDVALPVFLVIVAAATAVLSTGLGHAVRVVWSVFPAPVLIGYLPMDGVWGRGEMIALVVAALAFAAVGVAVAWYETLVRRQTQEYVALVVVPTATPLALLSSMSLLAPGWPIGVALAALYLGVSVVVARRSSDDGAILLSTVVGVAGSVLLLTAWVELGGIERSALAVIVSSIAYALAAGLWSRPWLDWVAGIGVVLSAALYVVVNRPFLALSASAAVDAFTWADVAASVAVTVLAVIATWWAMRRFRDQAEAIVLTGAVSMLVGVSVSVVALGVTLGELVDGARDGFLAAHLLVTVLWISCAAWLVLTSRSWPARAHRWGFVLGALALAKLLLLDLATLPGLFRVLSFIAVGGVMLAVAVRYKGGDDDAPADFPAVATPRSARPDDGGAGSSSSSGGGDQGRGPSGREP